MRQCSCSQGGPGNPLWQGKPAMLVSLEVPMAPCEGDAGVQQPGELLRHNAIPPAGAERGKVLEPKQRWLR